ncbi:hypothetical protein [Aliivibrio fischeri]|uniref:AbiTii domain-containing protein n=1 Tax=Aliivibrio fischeri TaxID=668 RepID=UPI0032219EF6|nr:hypothetical protein [Aliivibrio fischeri]
MSLLRDIQASLISNDAELSTIFLKLRLLAARLGSDILGDWVKHEVSGYPQDVDLPAYRIVPVTYKGTFSGPFNSGVKNAPIPSKIVNKLAGDAWVNHRVREGIAAIDELVSGSKESGSLGLNASDLILKLQGKVYPDYVCNEVTGAIPRSALVQIQTEVRSRVLELTLELEKSIPAAADIKLDPNSVEAVDQKKVSQITNQTIYGNYTAISNSGDGAKIDVKSIQGDSSALSDLLQSSGISNESAEELAKIVAQEQPTSPDEPLGSKAKQWLIENLKKAEDGSWKIGISVATDVIKKAVMGYYGL